MFAEIYAEFIKSLKAWVRKPMYIGLALGPPVILTFIFLQLFTISGGGGNTFDLLIIMDDDTSQPQPWTAKFLTALESEEGPIPYFTLKNSTRDKATELFRKRQAFTLITIPLGFENNLTRGELVTFEVKYNNIHEDLSKNIRLGIETRIYHFNLEYQLETGYRPGIYYESSTTHSFELARTDYMMSGIYVFIILYLTTIIGGSFGSEEKDQGNHIELEMAPYGTLYSRIGKILATILLTTIVLLALLLLNWLFYGPYISNFTSFLLFLGVYFCLALIFASLGVFYGMMVGDFRFIPAPSIILCVTIWILAGAINPLEFSAGSRVFKFLPTAAAIRILTAVIFQRGVEYQTESWIILGLWTILTIVVITFYIIIKIRRRLFFKKEKHPHGHLSEN
ncbi:hypothetical protein EU523_00520 [Candidatus Heimdallarchaeota archaeon]|nr:MAG: hypothetical protein EU523_00520 [Candidatus Heimdallarchaeota archaeon]